MCTLVTEYWSFHVRKHTTKLDICFVSHLSIGHQHLSVIHPTNPCMITANIQHVSKDVTARLFFIFYVRVCHLPKRARYCKVSRIIVSTQRSWLLLRPSVSRVFSVSWLLL